jgi:hypothetical protein
MSLRIRKQLHCFLSVGLALSGQFVFGQENSLRIAFPQTPTGRLSSMRTGATQDEKEIRLREKVLNASEDASVKEDVTKTSESKLDSVNSKDSDAPASVKPAPETKREPISLPILVVPNTAAKPGSGAMPDDMVSGRLPAPVPLPFGTDRHGIWSLERKTWLAPVYCHQPTYFHDSMLEEHGHERCPSLQPLISGARFYSQLAFLPYLSYLNPPLQDSYSTGHFRPGTAAPCIRQRAPYDPGAMRLQLLTTGTAVLIAQP